MKNLRLLSLLVVLLGVTTYAFTSQAAPRYWQRYIELIAEKYDRPDILERYTAANQRRTVSNAYIFSPSKYGSPYNVRYQRKSANTGNHDRVFTGTSQTSNVSVFARPLRQSQDILKIDSTPVGVFELGFFNRNVRSSNYYQEPVLINEVEFALVDNTGIADKYRHLLLTVEDQDFRFDNDGTVTLQFRNLRLAPGDDRSITVGIKIDDPSNVPNIPGSLRLRLTGATAKLESSGTISSINVRGTSVSELVAFNPIAEASGVATFLGNEVGKIYGKMLSAGDEAFVLAVGFRAHFDDLYIEKANITDVLSGGSIDTFVQRIEAIDLDTGRILDVGQFTGGVARFNFPKPVLVQREQLRRVGFRVYLKDRIYANQINTQFRLTLNAGDVKVTSRSTGTTLSDSNKTFTIENETFTIADSTLTLSYPSRQNRPLLITGNRQLVYNFGFTSNGGDSELARISLDVYPTNVNFPGGISADDFELVELDSTGARQIKSFSSTNSLNGNTVTFDFASPVDVYQGSTRWFGLKVALEDSGTVTDSDGIVISIPDDSSGSFGTLAQVRATNPNFIWSDRSARPHSTNSLDWSNGNQVPGLPTSSVKYKRGY